MGVTGMASDEEAPIYSGRFTVHSPHIRTEKALKHCTDQWLIPTVRYTARWELMEKAGKLFSSGDRASSCLAETPPLPTTPPVVQKFLNMRQPNPGVPTVFYAKANDPDVASSITHGVRTGPLLSAASLINVPSNTLFRQKLIEKRESLYSSHRRAPLGKSCDPTGALPATINLSETTFGRKYQRGLSASELINPPKCLQEIYEESCQGHKNYIISHNDYDVGEIKDRNYDWSNIKKDRRFGIETPHFNDGRNVERTIRCLHETKIKEGSNIVSKRFDDFHERTHYQLGKVLHPIADTLKAPPDH